MGFGGFGKGLGKGLGKGVGHMFGGWGKGCGKGAEVAAVVLAGAVVASAVARPRHPAHAQVVVVTADDVTVVTQPPPPPRTAAVVGGAVFGAAVAGPLGAIAGGALGAAATVRPPPSDLHVLVDYDVPHSSAPVVVMAYPRKGKGKGKGRGKHIVAVDAQAVTSQPEPSAPPLESVAPAMQVLEAKPVASTLGQLLEVKIPLGAVAGQSIPVIVPGERQLTLELPEGYSEGSSLQVWFEPGVNTLRPLP